MFNLLWPYALTPLGPPWQGRVYYTSEFDLILAKEMGCTFHLDINKYGDTTVTSYFGREHNQGLSIGQK